MTDAQVWLVLCIGNGEEQTFAFSSYETACAWADKDSERVHVIYSRVLDHPELADTVMQ